jgi:dihydroorotase
MDMVRLMSYAPAKLLGLDKGEVKEGKVADLTIFDPNKKYTYEENMIVSKSHNTPWIGKELTGEVAYTLVEGRVVYERV